MLKDLSIYALSRELSEGKLSSLELTEHCLSACREKSELGAFISLCPDLAIAYAKESDARRARGESLGELDGIPFGIKDNLCLVGTETTCGSRMLKDFIPPYTATAVSRLVAAGAIPIGKTNMDEFGMGNSSRSSAFGRVKNPHDISRTAGGSSGGSAVAVAAGLVPFALGSDTGGSVRLPAAYCGTVGMKPTYGGVSRYGLIAYASSLDTVGVFSSCARDNALVLSRIAGRDTMDMTSIDVRIDTNICDNDIKGMRIGIPYAALEGASSKIREAVLSVASTFESLGAVCVNASLPLGDEALAAYYVTAFSEASSNLARYDGVRYGYRSAGAKSAEELFVNSRSQGFGEEVKKRILLGTLFLSDGGRDEIYRRAVSARGWVQAKVNEALEACDALLLPVAPRPAPTYAELETRSSVEGYREDIFGVLANLCGLPALSFPSKTGKGGLPLGVQLMAPRLCEGRLYALCAAYERAEV